ncbi:serine protease [Jannaschia sp. S6380]|uniref:serine protease n=1 Tax=Jannaschia sp. S6380 TaxID=2926408 RepID=UPI001FF1D0DF|nr:serine protease [Jannaschia sp. S6380]MCK0166005.1 serine protease [Jannaschia sp. S6380]
MRAFLLVLLLSLAAQVAVAQERAYVQIEAHRNLAEATSRARAYGGIVKNINGYALPGGWYTITLGPYDPDRAPRVLRRLRAEGLIPRDSFVSDGNSYRDRFWPVGAQADAAVPAAPSVGDSTQTAGISVPETPAGPPEETLREARRSEAQMSREEKMDLQRALKWFGHYDAAIDGRFGRGTRNAMAAWQGAAGVEATGVLTTRQRARLRRERADAQAALGLAPLKMARAGVALTAPLGLVAFDRIEAPFVHYAPKDDSGVRLSLISQSGDGAALAGLYEILQTLAIVPPEGERGRSGDSFRISGLAPDRTTEVFARRIDDHIVGYILSWPETQDDLVARALPEMERSLQSTGRPLPSDAGFQASEQSFDMVSGLSVRQPLRSAAGFFVNPRGTVVTAAETVAGCGRVTLDRSHEVDLQPAAGGMAVLTPRARLSPMAVATLAPAEGRLRSAVSVAGFPYGGVLGSATLSFGSLEDVRGLDGDRDVLRLSLEARDGDVGGPVFDEAGRVAGMLLPDPEDAARALPDDVALALKAGALLRVLEGLEIEPATTEDAQPIAPEDLTRRAVAMTVLVDCWE